MSRDPFKDISLVHDKSLEQFKRFEVVPGTGLIMNGSMAIVGGTGTGKTSLITKIIKLYQSKVPGLHILYFGGEVDQTFSTNIKSGIILIDPKDLKKFLEQYAEIKKRLIEWINIVKVPKSKVNVLVLNDNVKKITQELKKSLKDTDDLYDYATEELGVYMESSKIAGIQIPPLVIKKGTGLIVVSTVSIFDDLTQLGKFTSDPSGRFLRIITANTRHFLNTSIFSMQRYTYLPSNVRKNVNTWILTKGLATSDIKVMLTEITLPDDITEEELIKEIEGLQKYEFLVVNSEEGVVRVLRT